MGLFGMTRSRITPSHALIAPESFVAAALPGWRNSQGIILISPRMGARFTQYLALMAEGAKAAGAVPSIERVIYVLSGEIIVEFPDSTERVVCNGGYIYWPPDTDLALRAIAPSRLNIFEKRYVARSGIAAPDSLCGNEREVAGSP